MAAFRNRHGKWQARVQRKGQQPISKSFQSKEDAKRWARQIEVEIDKGSFTSGVLAERTLFKDVVERYVQEVTLKTRSMKEDAYRLRALSRHPIAKLRMTTLTPIKIAESTCRYHGATPVHTRKNVAGENHPNYKNGIWTKEAKAERSTRSVTLRHLIDLGNQTNLFYKQLKIRGRPPSGYTRLDLTDPEQLAMAILKTLSKR